MKVECPSIKVRHAARVLNNKSKSPRGLHGKTLISFPQVVMRKEMMKPTFIG